ncbi:MAG: hypothetical protein L3K05_05000 [Thermoplasmata archaeon]|nr:hypothetical protein [Thermoplasmata archaeon]
MSVNTVVFALAEQFHPGFLWTEVQGGPEGPTGPFDWGWIPRERAFPSLVRTRRTRAGEPTDGAVFAVIQSGDSSDTVALLRGYLGLPVAAQDVLCPPLIPAARSAVVVANADRLPPVGHSGLTPLVTLLELSRRFTYPLIVGHTGPAPSDRTGFEVALRVELDDLEPWRGGQIHCEQGGLGEILADGRSRSLGELPDVSSTFERALRASPRARPKEPRW